MAYNPNRNKIDVTPTDKGIVSWDSVDNRHETDADFPLISGTLVQFQGTPIVESVAATLTITELLTGIITGNHTTGATAAYTLPTGALVADGTDMIIGGSFDWYLINLSAAAVDTITVTESTGHTIVGNPIVQSAHVTTGGITGNSSHWRTRKTAVGSMITYRLG